MLGSFVASHIARVGHVSNRSIMYKRPRTNSYNTYRREVYKPNQGKSSHRPLKEKKGDIGGVLKCSGIMYDRTWDTSSHEVTHYNTDLDNSRRNQWMLAIPSLWNPVVDGSCNSLIYETGLQGVGNTPVVAVNLTQRMRWASQSDTSSFSVYELYRCNYLSVNIRLAVQIQANSDAGGSVAVEPQELRCDLVYFPNSPWFADSSTAHGYYQDSKWMWDQTLNAREFRADGYCSPKKVLAQDPNFHQTTSVLEASSKPFRDVYIHFKIKNPFVQAMKNRLATNSAEADSFFDKQGFTTTEHNFTAADNKFMPWYAVMITQRRQNSTGPTANVRIQEVKVSGEYQFKQLKLNQGYSTCT